MPLPASKTEKGINRMKQLGNLAVVCAKRPETLLQIYGGRAIVYVGSGPDRTVLCAAWDDDAQICCIIHALNFGTLRSEKAA